MLVEPTRRTFLGTMLLPAFATRWRGPNETVRVAILGLRGRGNDLHAEFRKVPGVTVAALCDVDPAVLDQRLTEAKKHGESPVAYADPRRVFDDAGIDAVVVATPNHTHALLAVLALQAGKHVYVEKPVAHDLEEGRRLVAAARHHRGIVQAGTQNRSEEGLIAAYAALHAGELGKIRSIHGICYRDRAGIGKRSAPLSPPPGLDYDLWLGPAQDVPILRDSFHYDWHWSFNTGNGDVGNQGPHELDMICWALRDPGLPQFAFSVGGRLGWNDAGDTPNVQACCFRFAGGIPVGFEVRNLVPKPRTGYHGLDSTGVVVTTDRGELRAQRGGAVFVDPDGKQLHAWKGPARISHAANFIEAVRQGDRASLRSEVELGHHAAAMAHLANASFRLGRAGSLEEARKASADLAEFGGQLDRMADTLARCAVADPRVSIGARLEVDPATGMCTDPAAKALLAREARRGHEVPLCPK